MMLVESNSEREMIILGLQEGRVKLMPLNADEPPLECPEICMTHQQFPAGYSMLSIYQNCLSSAALFDVILVGMTNSNDTGVLIPSSLNDDNNDAESRKSWLLADLDGQQRIELPVPDSNDLEDNGCLSLSLDWTGRHPVRRELDGEVIESREPIVYCLTKDSKLLVYSVKHVGVRLNQAPAVENVPAWKYSSFGDGSVVESKNVAAVSTPSVTENANLSKSSFATSTTTTEATIKSNPLASKTASAVPAARPTPAPNQAVAQPAVQTVEINGALEIFRSFNAITQAMQKDIEKASAAWISELSFG